MENFNNQNEFENEINNTETPIVPLLSWQAKEYQKVIRQQNWYITALIIAFALTTYALFTDNLLMAILLILLSVTFYIFEKKEPKTYKFALTDEGVIAHNKIYEYSSLESFWIFYSPNGKKLLSLKSKKSFIPYVRIPLDSANPVEIRNTLMKFIPEIKQSETLLDAVEKFI